MILSHKPPDMILGENLMGSTQIKGHVLSRLWLSKPPCFRVRVSGTGFERIFGHVWKIVIQLSFLLRRKN